MAEQDLNSATPLPEQAPAPPPPPPERRKRKRRLGDRGDGRKLRSLQPMNRVAVYIMKTRMGSINYAADSVEITSMEQYIRQMRKAGYKNFGAMHVILAAYVRTISQRPAVNRFISGQKIYARNNIEVCMTIKKSMHLDADETCIKVAFEPWYTAEEVYKVLDETIEREKAAMELGSTFDKVAKIFRFIPGLVLKFTMWVLNLLDYFGLIPKSLLAISPFHGSLVLTSMGSLGIPPIYHHLYNFGNVPVFLAFGAKRTAYETQKDGSVATRRYIDYKMSTDERICDGYYFASALKYFKHLLKNPEVLSERPAEIVEDVD